ncbi:MAG: hypothetical protein ACRC3I_01980 [Cetobacterium sp.]
MENVKQLMRKRAEYKQELELEKEKYNHLQEKIENVVSIEEFDKIDNEINRTVEKIAKIERVLENFGKNEEKIIETIREQKNKEWAQEEEILEKNYKKLNKEFLKFMAKVEQIAAATETEIQNIEKPLEKEFQTLRSENKIGKFDFMRMQIHKIESAKRYFEGAYTDLVFQEMKEIEEKKS